MTDATAHGGSSPLARGLLRRERGPRRRRRIIPARAGFTGVGGRNPCTDRDHPRSRGVYGPRTGARAAGWGSSPLARGLRQHHRLRPPPRRDHPRSRGVYARLGPAARGAPGIIPARAGFTSRPGPRRRGRTDHPRSRGVYWCRTRRSPGRRGSSPLARGLPIHMACESAEQGIIPARAGFTPSAPSPPSWRRDHPRSRGVYPTASHSHPVGAGSSPLARGLHRLTEDQVAGWGIIPARAGFTRHPGRGDAQRRDHPRSRGVYHARHRRRSPA